VFQQAIARLDIRSKKANSPAAVGVQSGSKSQVSQVSVFIPLYWKFTVGIVNTCNNIERMSAATVNFFLLNAETYGWFLLKIHRLSFTAVGFIDFILK
jgi:hypothetical protein